MSEIVKKINKIQDTIKILLEIQPALRDDDNKLIAEVWRNELYGRFVAVYEFLELFAEGKFTNPETIRRTRQILQERHPELRGDLYNKRQKQAVETRIEITDI